MSPIFTFDTTFVPLCRLVQVPKICKAKKHLLCEKPTAPRCVPLLSVGNSTVRELLTGAIISTYPKRQGVGAVSASD